MKKRIPTFLSGMLTMALIGGLGVTAMAATGQMTITVDPISIQVNGQTFTPQDANGANVPVFAYNGTTYAPLRALAEAYGLEVGYDAEANMATVKSPVQTSTPSEDSIKFYPNSKVPMLENIIDVSYADTLNSEDSVAYYYSTRDLDQHGGSSVISQFDTYLTSLGYRGTASTTNENAILYINTSDDFDSLAVFMEQHDDGAYLTILAMSS